MISLIYSEFLKLKRSSIIFYMAIGSSFMPLLLDAAILISNDRHRTYESYMYNSEGISFTFMHGILFSIIAAYVFSREFNYKTSGNLYSYSLDKVDFELEDSNGNEHNIEIEAVNDDNDLNWIVEKNDSSYPLYRQNGDLNYWYKYLEEAKAVYFKYNSCIEDEDIGTIKDMTDEIFDLIDRGKADKLIIDVRNNSGGSDGYLNELIEGIKARNINNPDKLFVIIGRETFSSAIIEAARLDEETNATLVGEMTSGKPNHYGAVGNFKLPNSKISIRYSTKHINIFKNQGNSLMPDVLKEVSIDDYINKKDPVLDYILQNS